MSKNGSTGNGGSDDRGGPAMAPSAANPTSNRRRLAGVFFFLLWGDFCFNTMEQVIPAIMPLKLNSLGASNVIITTLTSTIYYLMNMMVTPVVGVMSDRYRSRLGRRIPFLLFGTPFVTGALVLLAFSEDIGHRLAWLGAVVGLSAQGTVVLTMAAFLVCFQFFNMVIYSVYFYLFNDVVPEPLLGRFFGLFRIVGYSATFLFSLLVFPYALSHLRAIFLGAAALYFSAFMLMCWGIREGRYPPPPPLDRAASPFWGAVKTYLRECFTVRLYLYFFLFMALMQASWAVNPFYNLFCLSIGMTMEQIGRYNAWLYLPGILLMYPAGMVVDRLGPVRGFLMILPGYLAYGAVSYFFVRDFHTWLWVAIFYLPLNAMRGVVESTIAYSTLPRERFGQFSSANSMLSSLVAAIAGIVAGTFMDRLKNAYGGDQGYYRYIFIWNLMFWAAASVVMVLLYREWKRVVARNRERRQGEADAAAEDSAADGAVVPAQSP